MKTPSEEIGFAMSFNVDFSGYNPYADSSFFIGQKVTVTKLTDSVLIESENMGRKFVKLEIAKHDLRRLFEFLGDV